MSVLSPKEMANLLMQKGGVEIKRRSGRRWTYPEKQTKTMNFLLPAPVLARLRSFCHLNQPKIGPSPRITVSSLIVGMVAESLEREDLTQQPQFRLMPLDYGQKKKLLTFVSNPKPSPIPGKFGGDTLQVVVKFPLSLFESIEEMAREHKVTRSDIVRGILQIWLDY